MLLPHIRSLILSLPNILPGQLLRPSPPSAKVAASSRSGSIKRKTETLLRRGMRMNRTLIWEEAKGGVVVVGDHRRAEEPTVGPGSSFHHPKPPILLRTMGSEAPSPSSSHHGSLDDLDEA